MPHAGLSDPDGLFRANLQTIPGLVVAVSGGPDSMALLHLLAQWKHHPRLHVATVDHGLRAGSDAEAAMVARYAEGLGLPHATLHWRGPKPDTAIQEAARAMRYRLLSRHALETGSSHMVTAHHADDQAETVLQRLLSGSGIAGLAGMEDVVDRDFARHVRPLLAIPKADLVSYCTKNNVPFVQDPGNTDPRFGRTRMRELMILLAGDGLTGPRLCTLAERARRADEALSSAAEDVFLASLVTGTTSPTLDWGKVSRAQAEIRLRVLTMLMNAARDNSEPLRLERLENLEHQLSQAHGKGPAVRRSTFRRSLADRILTLDRDGMLVVTPAPPRRRGMPRP